MNVFLYFTLSFMIVGEAHCVVCTLQSTCVDTLAASHLPRTIVRASSASNLAEDLKIHYKYVGFYKPKTFGPLGVES